jgi:hypothetical protein
MQLHCHLLILDGERKAGGNGQRVQTAEKGLRVLESFELPEAAEAEVQQAGVLHEAAAHQRASVHSAYDLGINVT